MEPLLTELCWALDSNNDPYPSRMPRIQNLFQSSLGKVWVSTIFLSIDHNLTGVGDPVLFETMIFGGKHDGYQRRYTTYKDAKAGHKAAVRMSVGWFRRLFSIT